MLYPPQVAVAIPFGFRFEKKKLIIPSSAALFGLVIIEIWVIDIVVLFWNSYFFLLVIILLFVLTRICSGEAFVDVNCVWVSFLVWRRNSYNKDAILSCCRLIEYWFAFF